MGSRFRRSAVGVAAALLLCLAATPASHSETQTLSPEQLELLKSLTPEQRDEILRAYGRAPAASEREARDVSAPETVTPREQGSSEIEASVAGPAEEVGIPEARTAPPLEPLTEEAAEIRRAFQNFLAESQPLEVDQNLSQFGYDLFAGAPTTFAPATDIPVSADYIIGPGDEIHVQLYGKDNLTADLTVDRDGMIPFPELGPLTVAGLTFREMKDLIAREVEKRMIGIEVSVSMGRLRSIRIFVLGDVFRPGSYTVSGLSTLTNALFASGGVQKIGSLRGVQLKRDGEVVQEMDLYDLLVHGDTSSDARLMPGDVIFVPPVGPLVGVAGEILRPAIYEMKGAMTARDLIELAGGLRPTAYLDLIQLERVEDGRRVTYDMSYAGTDEWRLESGDLLKIYPILERDERAVFLEGNVIRPGKRQYFDGMRLLDLVSSPSDLLPETFFDYGLIERESPINREPEYIAFDLRSALLEGDAGANLALEPRDRVYVFHRAHFREIPRVSIRGEVRSPGKYEYKKDMRALDLVLAAGGLTRDAWLPEAELFRTDPATLEVQEIPLDLLRVLAADDAENLPLQDLDELAVHSIWEFRRHDEVQIIGEVNAPGRYPLVDGMRVSDLIFAGGNLKETAYIESAELSRYEIVGGERRQLRHVPIDLRGVLEGGPDADLLLQPYDKLLVRRISNWRGDEVVRVEGEVGFPGSYPIEEGERLSDLIERFGGFLPDAYLPAAVFTRSEVRRLQADRLSDMANQLEADLARLSVSGAQGGSSSDQARRQSALEAGSQLVQELKTTEATGRMVIALAPADELRGTEHDVVLADGDRLYVPKQPDFVMVIGQVNNPTAFKFEKGKGTGHYIRLAGGKTRFGDLGKTYVVKADGSVERRGRMRIDPGDVVIVPETLERFGGMQFVLDLSQVLYQIGIAVASAHTVGLLN